MPAEEAEYLDNKPISYYSCKIRLILYSNRAVGKSDIIPLTVLIEYTDFFIYALEQA